MARRSYRQNCALARAADLIGERWTLLLLRDLLLGPRRFRDLARSERGMGSNLLAARLKELEAAGIIARQSAGNGHPQYTLTERGQALEPALLALVRWGLVYGPENRDGDHHLDDWDLVALKALFQSARATDLDVTVQFSSDGFEGWMAIDHGQVTTGLGRTAQPDVLVNGTIKDLFTGSGSPADTKVSGSLPLLEQFVSSFALRA